MSFEYEENNEDEEEIEKEDNTSSESQEESQAVNGTEDGRVFYPWQMDYFTKADLAKDAILLKASILSISSTGNLTVVFNKPIIVPPIIIDPISEFTNVTESNRRVLQDQT